MFANIASFIALVFATSSPLCVEDSLLPKDGSLVKRMYLELSPTVCSPLFVHLCKLLCQVYVGAVAMYVGSLESRLFPDPSIMDLA